jgi:hypothetical protein
MTAPNRVVQTKVRSVLDVEGLPCIGSGSMSPWGAGRARAHCPRCRRLLVVDDVGRFPRHDTKGAAKEPAPADDGHRQAGLF